MLFWVCGNISYCLTIELADEHGWYFLQGHHLRKAQLIPKPVLRKKRSFSRQVGKFGRGKQQNVMQGVCFQACSLFDFYECSFLCVYDTSGKITNRDIGNLFLKAK